MSGASRWKDRNDHGSDRDRFKKHFTGPERRTANSQGKQYKPAPSGNAPVSSSFPKDVSISVSTQDGSIPFEILVWFEVNCGAITKHSISPDSNQGLIAFTSEKSKVTALSLSPVSLLNKCFSIEEINEKRLCHPVGQKTDALILKNLPFSMRPAALTEFMNQFSHPPLSIIYHYLVNGKFKGSVLVQYTNADEAAEVMSELNGISIEGRSIRVEYKRQKNNEQEGEEYNQMFNQLQKFKHNTGLREFEFPSSTWTSYQRKQLHTIATKLNLFHASRSDNGEHYLVISKDPLIVDNPRESNTTDSN